MTLLFAWRYFKAKKSTNAINIISWISVLAIAVGSAALILVLSVFNGFEGLVKSLYADFYADIRITPAAGKYFTLSKEQIANIKAVKGVKELSLMAEEKAVLVNDQYQSIIFLKGVDENYPRVSGLPQHVTKGKFQPGNAEKPLLILGSGIENAIGAEPEKNISPLTVYLPNRKAASLSGVDALNSYNVYVGGSFVLQQDFDNKYVVTNIGFVKYMLDLGPDDYSAAEIKIEDPDQVVGVDEALSSLLHSPFRIQTRYQQNQSLYSVMQVEKWFIYAILTLILVVAAFNMIGALTMLVLEKQKDISVLQALGADKGYIQKIFLQEGFVLAAVGGGTGVFIAYFVCFLQLKFHLLKLEGGSFIIDYYPVQMLPGDFILVTVTIFLISVLAAWLPALKASRQKFSLKS